MSKISVTDKIPLASIQWLKYLGVIFVILSIYIIAQCYYHYSDDIFSKSLTIGQHVKLSIFSVGSTISNLFFPLFFFSGALIYSSVRQKRINPLNALKLDLLIIVPLAISLWFFCAFGEEPTGRKFYAMVYDIQLLEQGEQLIQDPSDSELFAGPNLNGLYENIDTLDFQIKNAEEQLVDQLVKLVPPIKLENLITKIDFGSSSLKPKDFLNSSSEWDGIERSSDKFMNPPMLGYIENLQNQQSRYQDEINVIYFTPLYIILFLILGMLLGYLLPLNKIALMAILITIGFSWYLGVNVLESSLDPYHSKQSSLILGKIGLLIVLNATLSIVARRVYKGLKVSNNIDEEYL